MGHVIYFGPRKFEKKLVVFGKQKIAACIASCRVVVHVTDTMGISPSRRTSDHIYSRSSITSCAFACRAESSGVSPKSFLRCLSAPYRSTVVGVLIIIRKVGERGGEHTKTSPFNRVINGSHV